MGWVQWGYVPTGFVQWRVLEVQQPCNDQKTCLADIMQQPNLPGRTTANSWQFQTAAHYTKEQIHFGSHQNKMKEKWSIQKLNM